MAIQEAQTIQPLEAFQMSAGDRVRLNELYISPEIVLPHYETVDFPLKDPWSIHMRHILEEARARGVFAGKELTELGIGDARNVLVAVGTPGDLPQVTHIRGIDVENWRALAGMANIKNNPATAGIPFDISGDTDAVAYLHGWKTGKPQEKLSGNVIMCLPQSPDGQNAADRYDQSPLLADYAEWDKYGLTLNAAVLGNLRKIAASDTRVFIMLSGRVPEEKKDEMVQETGWEIINKYQTEEPIQQDPDTGIGWVSAIDDGQRFHEFVEGEFRFLPAREAEERRLKSLADHTEREGLNVYHHLSVYELQPTRPFIVEVFKSVSPNGNGDVRYAA